METSQEPERFSDEAREIVEEIVNSDPNKMVSDADFGNIICPRQNFMAVLYVAAQRGHKKYKSSKANLAVRWQFKSTSRLLELINDPDKMDKEVNILNGSIGGPPPSPNVPASMTSLELSETTLLTASVQQPPKMTEKTTN